jgi:hypothetical protein
MGLASKASQRNLGARSIEKEENRNTTISAAIPKKVPKGR